MPAGVRPGFAIWLTGLPASGKTTLAYALSRRLAERHVHTQVLDSDALREKLTPDPTYARDERDRFYALLAFIAGLLTDNGVNVLIAATGLRRAYRETARGSIQRFAEVFVDCPPAVCRQRDPKGLWARADAGEIDRLPGAGAPYEPPANPEVRVDTSQLSVDDATDWILRQLEEQDFFA